MLQSLICPMKLRRALLYFYNFLPVFDVWLWFLNCNALTSLCATSCPPLLLLDCSYLCVCGCGCVFGGGCLITVSCDHKLIEAFTVWLVVANLQAALQYRCIWNTVLLILRPFVLWLVASFFISLLRGDTHSLLWSAFNEDMESTAVFCDD